MDYTAQRNPLSVIELLFDGCQEQSVDLDISLPITALIYRESSSVRSIRGFWIVLFQRSPGNQRNLHGEDPVHGFRKRLCSLL